MAQKLAHPLFYFLVCPDSTLLLDHVSLLLEKFKASYGSWERLTYWGDKTPESNFWSDLQQKYLLPHYRAVVVRKANEWPAEIWKNLNGALKELHEQAWPIFCLENSFEKGKAKIPAHILKTGCYKYAEKMGWLWIQPPLSGNSVVRYTNEKAKSLGLQLTPASLDLFCSSVLPDAASINNELEKLSLVVGKGKITPEMLNMDTSSPETDAFNCIRKLYSGNLCDVWQELRRSDNASLLFFLVALLSREFRICWQILSGMNPGLLPKAVEEKNKLARKLGFSGLAEAFALLADAECQVKSGRLTPEQSLEKLVILLSGLCSTGKPYNLGS